jgi:hypothetical protein
VSSTVFIACLFQDLVRRMLKLDPAERASIPEVLNHVWMRQATNSLGHLDTLPTHLFGSLSVSASVFAGSGSGKPDKNTKREGRQYVSSSPGIDVVDSQPQAHSTTPTGEILNSNAAEIFMEDMLNTPPKSTMGKRLSRPNSACGNDSAESSTNATATTSSQSNTQDTTVLYGLSGGRMRRGNSSNSVNGSTAQGGNNSELSSPSQGLQQGQSPQQVKHTRHLSFSRPTSEDPTASIDSLIVHAQNSSPSSKASTAWVSSTSIGPSGNESINSDSKRHVHNRAVLDVEEGRVRCHSDADAIIGTVSTPMSLASSSSSGKDRDIASPKCKDAKESKDSKDSKQSPAILSTFRLEPLHRNGSRNSVDERDNDVDDDDDDDGDYEYSYMNAFTPIGASQQQQQQRQSPALVAPSDPIAIPSSNRRNNNNANSSSSTSLGRSPGELSASSYTSTGSNKSSSSRPKTVNSEGRGRRDRNRDNNNNDNSGGSRWVDMDHQPDELSAPITSPYNSGGTGGSGGSGGRRGGRRGAFLC